MPKSKQLEPICWVSRPKCLAREIGEEFDLCRACADKQVAAYRKQFPSHADEITVGGGYDYNHESDGPATCSDCGDPLASWVLSSRKSVYTLAQWERHP